MNKIYLTYNKIYAVSNSLTVHWFNALYIQKINTFSVFSAKTTLKDEAEKRHITSRNHPLCN